MQLKLDFGLNGASARLDYINKYIAEQDPSKFTQENIEMMSNYLLWGVQSEGELDCEIESKNSPWQKKTSNDVSYEGMLEKENETGMSVYAQLAESPIPEKKRKLDRDKVVLSLRENQPDWIRTTAIHLQENPSAIYSDFITGAENLALWNPLAETWFLLWGQIDTTEFMVQTWEMKHGKRRPDLPIRSELHFRLAQNLVFTKSSMCLQEFENQLAETQAKWDGYTYLKKKRGLVTLRTQQYSLLDSTQGDVICKHNNTPNCWEGNAAIEEFYPFMQREFLMDGVNENCFNQEFYDLCIKALQRVDNYAGDGLIIDFRNADTIRGLLTVYPDLVDAVDRDSTYAGETLHLLLRYLDYYIAQCHFEPELDLILRMKIKKVSNKEIAILLKENFNLNYKENYISTIFTKRIIEAIVEQVELHYKLIEFITMGKTVFKRCTKCGRLLPRNTTYFNKRTSTSDGFFSSCKQCKSAAKK